MKVLTQKNIKITFLVVLLTVVCIDNRFSKAIVFRGENAAYEFIKAILKEYEYCKKVMKKHFNKNLIISEEEEEHFNIVTVTGFKKNLLIRLMKKLEIIVT